MRTRMRMLGGAVVLALGCGKGDGPRVDGSRGDATVSGSGTTGDGDGHGESTTETGPSESRGETTETSTSDASDDSGEGGQDTGGVEGQTIVVGVGNWGHRGMTIDGVRWTETMNEPPPGGDDHTPDLLRGVGYGAGMFVAVGGDANGMIMSTTDGVVWQEDLYPAGTDWLGDVAYLDGVWVAVGGNGVVVRSTDGGSVWAEAEERLAWAGRTILAAEGKLVAAGDAGSIAVSTDLGVTWEETTHSSTISFGLAHGLDTFVGFGSQWNGSGFDTACIVSDDANTWSLCPLASASFGRPAAGEGAIVVQLDGGWAVTTDGTEWSEIAGEFPTQLVRGDGVWVGTSYMRRWYAPSYEGPWESFEHPDGFRDLAEGAVAR